MDVISWFRGFVVQPDQHDTIVKTEQRTEALKMCVTVHGTSHGDTVKMIKCVSHWTP